MERKENKVRFCERSEVFADWKWLLTYSRRCKKMIALYIALGVLGTTVGLFGSVAGKYLIDIVTGYDTARLPLLVFAAIGSTAVSIAFDCVVSRVLKKLEIDLNNNVRADVFDRILDADWQALHAFSCGDILNRFETDTGAVGGGAVSWLPQILVTAYRLCAVFFLIWIYSPVMALIALGGAPVVLLLSASVLKKRRAFENKLRRLGSEMTAFEAETFYTVDTVKSLGTMQSQSRKLKEKQEALRTCSLQYNMFSVRVNALLRVAGAFTQFTAMGYGLYLLWTRAITFGTLTLFLRQGRGRLPCLLAHPARGKRRWCVFCSDSFTRKADVLCCAGRMDAKSSSARRRAVRFRMYRRAARCFPARLRRTCAWQKRTPRRRK